MMGGSRAGDSVMIPILHGQVKGGKLVLDSPQSYLVELSRLEGRRIELTIRKERHTRSLSQNKYYWGVVIEILSSYFGYDREEMHEALKFKFLKKHGDTDLATVGSTSKLSTAGFTNYIDEIIRWAAIEYQVVIPSADEVDIEL